MEVAQEKTKGFEEFKQLLGKAKQTIQKLKQQKKEFKEDIFGLKEEVDSLKSQMEAMAIDLNDQNERNIELESYLQEFQQQQQQ